MACSCRKHQGLAVTSGRFPVRRKLIPLKGKWNQECSLWLWQQRYQWRPKVADTEHQEDMFHGLPGLKSETIMNLSVSWSVPEGNERQRQDYQGESQQLLQDPKGCIVRVPFEQVLLVNMAAHLFPIGCWVAFNSMEKKLVKKISQGLER